MLMRKHVDMRPLQVYICCLLVTAYLASCKVGGEFTKPVVHQAPASYPQSPTVYDTLSAVRWFDLYQDTVLQRLIRITLDSNRNLLAAANRIEESREIAGIVKANLYPAFGYQLSAGGGEAGTEAQKVGGGLDKGVFKTYATLNWELDIWGKLRYMNQAAYQDFLADVDNRNALVVSLVAEVAQLYFVLCDLDNRMKIAERTLAARRESTRIIAERFSKGYVSEIDKLQAEQQEALAAVTIPNFRRQIIITENAIRVLMGMGPGSIPRGKALYEQQVSPDIPEGLPSQLLERRPDIRAAERRLEAQFNYIGVAKASLYPSFSLTGLLGFASPQLSTLVGGSGFVANGFANLVGPIFEFNRNKRRIRVEEYRTKQLAYQYEQVCLQAFADVDNALAQYRTFAQEYDIRHTQVMATRKSLELTQARYDFGYSSYYEVLIQQNYLFDAELAESSTLQQKINAIVFLYKSLGGGWQP
jgi:multidrug efflux system outer membrane protein